MTTSEPSSPWVVGSPNNPGDGNYVPMAVEEYAALQSAMGENVVKAGDCFWRRVRPLFYRPLLPFQQIAAPDPPRPWLAHLGAVQFVVGDGSPANSSMKFILSEPAKEYQLNSLDYNRKRQVRLASKLFEIRPLTSASEFKEKAHSVYLEFYERTRYAYKAERKSREKFASWVNTLFAFPQILILGAYEGAELRAVGISERVGDTILYSTFFGTTEATRRYASDLMLHSTRQIAARTEGVRRVFAGMFKGGGGLDDSYLLRGFQVVTKRAIVKANLITLTLLRILPPDQRTRLFGTQALGSVSVPGQAGVKSLGNRSVP